VFLIGVADTRLHSWVPGQDASARATSVGDFAQKAAARRNNKKKKPCNIRWLFDCDALREVSGLIYVAASADGCVASEELEAQTQILEEQFVTRRRWSDENA
jgi:hypothetical protein